MFNSLTFPLIAGIVIVISAVLVMFWYSKSYTKKKANDRAINNQRYKFKRRLLYSAMIGLIVGVVVCGYIVITEFNLLGFWRLSSVFIFMLISFAVTMIVCNCLWPIAENIRRNILVRNQEFSLNNILKTFGKILLAILPLLLAFFGGILTNNEAIMKTIFGTGFAASSVITMIFLAKRTHSINAGIRLGCKANPNIEAVWHNNITAHDINDCISCDSSSLTHNFIIKHDIADVSFSTANFRTVTSSNFGQTDHAEVVHYKISKKCPSPIICTFDKELTDSPLPTVETENPDFNKEFTTYCEKDDDAFYILTPQVMEKMLGVAKTYKRVIYNFDEDDLFIIIYHDKFLTSLKQKDVEGAFNDMKQLVNDLVYKNIAKPGAHVDATPLSEEDPEEFVTNIEELASQGIKINQKPIQVNSKKAVTFFIVIFAFVIIFNIAIFTSVFALL